MTLPWSSLEAGTSYPEQPLVVGAGPVGLGVGLFLARQGRAPRVSRCATNRSASRALAVNPRTWASWADRPQAAANAGSGLPIRRIGSPAGAAVAACRSPASSQSYPFSDLALSQATTERLFAEALEAEGGIERGSEDGLNAGPWAIE